MNMTSSLPASMVGTVVAKTEEYREGSAQNGHWHDRQIQPHPIVEFAIGMLQHGDHNEEQLCEVQIVSRRSAGKSRADTRRQGTRLAAGSDPGASALVLLSPSRSDHYQLAPPKT